MRCHFSLLSLNVLCGTFFDPLPIRRHMSQIKKIREMNPDILCLQEFNNPYIEQMYSNEFCKTHHLIVQRRTRKDYLQRFSVLSVLCLGISKVFSPVLFLLANPYIHNFLIGNQEIGNVLFVKKDISVVKTNSIQFKTQTGDFLNLFRKRGYTECIIHDKIHIRNVHLNHQQNIDNSIQSQIDETFSNLPLDKNLIVGDFNLDNFCFPSHFEDCCQHLGPTYRIDNPLTDLLQEDKRIDYIFSNNVKIISSTKIIDLESDHDGLLIHFEI